MKVTLAENESFSRVKVHRNRYKGIEYHERKTVVACPELVWLQNGIRPEDYIIATNHLIADRYITATDEIIFYAIIIASDEEHIFEILEIYGLYTIEDVFEFIRHSICLDPECCDWYSTCEVIYDNSVICTLSDLITR